MRRNRILDLRARHGPLHAPLFHLLLIDVAILM
jgi:hypothetical protein